jgi:hypothetical protein
LSWSEQTADFSTAAASAPPPSVEMTVFGVPGKKTDNCKDNSRFLHCGGKCAAFGRNDGFWVLGRNKQLQLQLRRQLRLRPATCDLRLHNPEA